MSIDPNGDLRCRTFAPASSVRVVVDLSAPGAFGCCANDAAGGISSAVPARTDLTPRVITSATWVMVVLLLRHQPSKRHSRCAARSPGVLGTALAPSLTRDVPPGNIAMESKAKLLGHPIHQMLIV